MDNFLGIGDLPCEDMWAKFITKEGKVIPYKSLDCSKQVKPEDEEEDIAMIGYESFFEHNYAEKAFLISPSYSHSDYEHEYHDYVEKFGNSKIMSDYWNKSENLIKVLDERTSELVIKSKGRLIGLCGLNYEWDLDKMKKRLHYCLNLPGMKGVKIHAHAHNDVDFLKSLIAQQNLASIFEEIEKYNPAILWHLHPTLPENCNSASDCDFNEITFIYNLAKKHNRIQFILAHSMYDERYIDFLRGLEIIDKTRLANLYLETSATEYDLVSAWRRFGLDRVLFGSDNFNKNNFTFRGLNAVFNQDEVHQIGTVNAVELLRKIN